MSKRKNNPCIYVIGENRIQFRYVSLDGKKTFYRRKKLVSKDNHEYSSYFKYIPLVNGPIKVGYTNNIEKRLKELQTGNPRLLKCIAYRQVPEERFGRAIEKALHQLLSWKGKKIYRSKINKKKWSSTEWFDCTQRLGISVLKSFPNINKKLYFKINKNRKNLMMRSNIDLIEQIMLNEEGNIDTFENTAEELYEIFEDQHADYKWNVDFKFVNKSALRPYK